MIFAHALFAEKLKDKQQSANVADTQEIPNHLFHIGLLFVLLGPSASMKILPEL